METFPALLAICAGNSPVPGEFPTQRPATRSFDVFFDLHIIKRLSKHSLGWWFETLSPPLWRHRNEDGVQFVDIYWNLVFGLYAPGTNVVVLVCMHDDVIKWKYFPRYWPFVRWIHRSPVISPHKGQWRGALIFSLIYVWINGWVNNREAGDLRRYRAHYDVIVMVHEILRTFVSRLHITKTMNSETGT